MPPTDPGLPVAIDRRTFVAFSALALGSVVTGCEADAPLDPIVIQLSQYPQLASVWRGASIATTQGILVVVKATDEPVYYACAGNCPQDAHKLSVNSNPGLTPDYIYYCNYCGFAYTGDGRVLGSSHV